MLRKRAFAFGLALIFTTAYTKYTEQETEGYTKEHAIKVARVPCLKEGGFANPPCSPKYTRPLRVFECQISYLSFFRGKSVF